MRKPSLFILLIIISFSLFAQDNSTEATLAQKRIEDFQKRKLLSENSLVSNLEFQSIGPTVFSGRVTDLAVSPTDPSHFYVAYASGGLWKTTNNGNSFSPLFDDEIVMTIGDIAVNWEKNIIWVGTGENNSSRSSYSGVGMFKSTDGGKTWAHKGLPESHHISRIILHPSNPDILWVAVLGHLYSPNKERGIYKTTDGGNTWKQVLFVNENAGAVDLLIDPNNPNTLYAATWERTRRAWNFVESGSGSGIYQSTDGGENWTLTTTANSGFPTGDGVGRIGIAITKQNDKTILYALLDNYFRREKKKKENDDLTKDDLRNISVDNFLKLDKKRIANYLKSNFFPKKYTAKKVISMVKKKKIKPLALVEYLENANSLLFDTPVIGAEIYRSDNNGKTWTKQNKYFLDRIYNSYGYYFGQIRIAPQDPDKLYFMGVPVMKSSDAGQTWESINGENVHVDHHALWLDPNRAGHLILGNDGGVHTSYDDGKTWIKCNSPSVGQFYYVAVDMEKPFNVYGGLQDNGVWTGPSTYKASNRWHGNGAYPYKFLLGGDGMQVAVDTRDNNTIYAGFQFGFYFRVNKSTGKRKLIKPIHELGERPLRFNWQTPIHLSVHNQDIFYLGANKLYRSFNQGDDYTAISDDLTKGGIKGDVPFGTLSAIHESSLKFGLIYTGSDDGLIHVTKDGGHIWTKISDSLPQNLWVSRIQASAFDEGTVYVCLNGYRSDDFNAYVYKSTDYGTRWTRIGLDLPSEPVNVIKEDPKNKNILYVGTDHALYVSLNKGNNFMQMKKGLAAVAVHDVVIHPRDQKIVVGTHGRSMYIGDVAQLQELYDTTLAKPIYSFPIASKYYNSNWGKQPVKWRKIKAPKLSIPVYSNSTAKLIVRIKAGKDLILKQLDFDGEKGLNYLEYDLSIQEDKKNSYEKWLNENLKKGDKKINLKKSDNGKVYLQKGKYIVEIEKNGKLVTEELVIN